MQVGEKESYVVDWRVQYSQVTSLTGEGKLYSIAPCPTESIYYQVTATSLSNVLRDLLRSGTEPALWYTHTT